MKKFSKRILAVMLAFIMAMPMMFALPSTVSASESVYDSNLVARYLTDSNITENKVLNSYNLEPMRNTSAGNASDFSFDGYSVKFSGGDNKPYLRAPLSEMLSTVDFTEGFTITFNGKRANDTWERYFELSSGKLVDGNSSGQMFQDGGPANTFFFTGRVEDNKNGWGRVKYNGTESAVVNLGDDGNWHFWSITIKKGSIAIYRDGTHAGTISDSSLICDAWYNSVKSGYLCLGVSSWIDPAYSGNMKDFRVYNIGMTENQIKALLEPNVVYNSKIDFRNPGSYTSSVSSKVATITSTDGGNKTLKGEKGDGMVITTSNSFPDGNYWPYNDLWDGECLSYYPSSSPNTVFQSGKDFRVLFHMGFRANDKVDSDPYAVMFNYADSTPIGLRRNGNLVFNATGGTDRKTYGAQVTPYNLNTGGDENKKEEYTKWFDFQYDYETNTLTYHLWSDAGGIDNTYTYRLSDYGVNLDPGAITSVCIGNPLYGRYAQCRFLEWYFYEPSVSASTKTSLQNLSAPSISAKSTGIVFNGGTAGRVTDNVIYPDASGYVESNQGTVNPSGNSNTQLKCKVLGPATTMVFAYTGNKNDVKIPVIAENERGGSTCKGYIANWLTTDSSDWKPYNDRWYQCSSYNNWNQTTSGDVNDTTIISTDTSHDPDYLQNKSGGTTSTIRLSNYVYYNGSGINTSNYVSSLSTPTFKVSYDARGDWTGGSGKWTNKTITGMVLGNKSTISIKVVNYSKWESFINDTVNSASFQSTLSDVINNEWKYTEDSVRNLYSTLIKISRFNINNYKFNIGDGWNELGDDMTEMQNEFNAYKNPTKKIFGVSFKNAAGTYVNRRTVTAGDSLGTLPTNTAAVYISNNQHNAYSWNGISSSTVIRNSTAYTENVALTACAFANVVHAATNAHNGYTDQKCSVCNHVDESQRVYNPLSWTDYDAYLADYNTKIASGNYTDDSVSDCTSTVSANTLNKASVLPSNTPQSTINSAANAIDAAVKALDGRASFAALNTAYETAYAWANDSARADEYTTSSIAAYKAYLDSTTEFPYEKAASRTNTSVSNQSSINSEAEKYNGAEAYAKANILNPLANLSKFEAAYNNADTFLKNLKGKPAQYTADSMNALIAAMTTANIEESDGGTEKTVTQIATANAEARADFGQAEQADADKLADAINDAMNSLEILADVEGADYTTYDEVVNKLNNFDPDAYDNTESIASAKSTINEVMESIGKSEVTHYGTTNINVLTDNATEQAIINALVSTTLTALNVSVKQYSILDESGEKPDESNFSVSGKTGRYDTATSKSPYGTTIVCDSGNKDTAWYIEITTNSMKKVMSYQGVGSRFQTKVLGATKVKAVKKGANQKEVRILRTYNGTSTNDKTPVQLVDYVDSGASFTLPENPTMALFAFDGYYVGGVKYNPNNTVTIDSDTVIYARYNSDASAQCAITASDISANPETPVNKTPAGSINYNDRITLEGEENTYAWVEATDSTGVHFRPFYIGKDVTFLASESTTLMGVSEAQFEAYKFSMPCVNLRKDGVETQTVTDSSSGLEVTKTIFNAQIVANGYDVKEYGILIGAPSDYKLAADGSRVAATNGRVNPTADQVVIENSGQQDGYAVYRAKSTKLVGANQFTIGINKLPDGYIYRGYLIYEDASGKLHNVYTETMR